jgi:hypothetical protein
VVARLTEESRLAIAPRLCGAVGVKRLYAAAPTLEGLGRRHALWNELGDEADHDHQGNADAKYDFKIHQTTSRCQRLESSGGGAARLERVASRSHPQVRGQVLKPRPVLEFRTGPVIAPQNLRPLAQLVVRNGRLGKRVQLGRNVLRRSVRKGARDNSKTFWQIVPDTFSPVTSR